MRLLLFVKYPNYFSRVIVTGRDTVLPAIESTNDRISLCENVSALNKLDRIFSGQTAPPPDRPKSRFSNVSRSLRDAAMMSSMRWALYNRARLVFPNVHLTYGYITKHVRIENGLEKSHAVDARCISGHPLAVPCQRQWKMRQVANHSRSLHVMNMTKGGKRRSAIAPHFIGKTRLQRHDKVLWNGIKCFIAGSTGGRPVLRDINWALVTPTASVNPKTVTFLSRKRGGFILQTI